MKHRFVLLSAFLLLIVGSLYVESAIQKPNVMSVNAASDTSEFIPLTIHTTDGKNLFGVEESKTKNIAVEKLRSKPEIPRRIALTFDDGPHPRHTATLLSVLKEKNVKATFFVHGNRVEKFPEITKQIVKDGHQIGNHSWDHTITKWTPIERVREEFARTDDIIYQATGIWTSALRPPGGLLTDRIREASPVPIVLWSVDPRDWKSRNRDSIIENTIASIVPGDIIILHDIYEPTVEAVPEIIDTLRARGYEFVTVNELIDYSEGEVFYFGTLE